MAEPAEKIVASFAQIYTRKIRESLRLSATWMPFEALKLGDVVLLRNHEYEHRTDLDGGYNIVFDVESAETSAYLEYTSAGSVRFAIKAAGTVPTPDWSLSRLQSGIRVSFGKKNAILFQATGCTKTRIKNTHQLGEKLIKLYDAKAWDKDYTVVTEVIHAELTTVLMSSQSGAFAEFGADADVKLGPQSLASAGAKLKLANREDLAVEIAARGALTPLFRAMGVNPRLFRSPQPGLRQRREKFERFVEVDYEDYSDQ